MIGPEVTLCGWLVGRKKSRIEPIVKAPHRESTAKNKPKTSVSRCRSKKKESKKEKKKKRERGRGKKENICAENVHIVVPCN